MEVKDNISERKKKNSKIGSRAHSIRNMARNNKNLLIAALAGIGIADIIYFLWGESPLGNISNVLQVVTVILAFFAWYNTQSLLEKRKNEKIMPASSDIILIVALAKPIEQVEPGVKNYIDINPDFHAIEGFANEELQGTVIDGSYMKLETRPDIKGALAISRIKDMPDDEENVKAYVQEFRECIEYVSELNFRTAHLFFSGPNEIAAFMMPYFVNSKDIILYRYVVQRQGYIRLDQVDARR